MADLTDGEVRNVRKDLTGQIFGSWLVLGPTEIHANPGGQLVKRWRCECACGTQMFMERATLVRSKSAKCRRCHTTRCIYPRLKEHPLYDVYRTMKGRCHSKTNPDYPHYGGRGIAVDEPWRSSQYEFYSDMMASWRHGMTLERKDNNGNYCKDNCCWATYREQANNRRSNRRLTWNGETKTALEWARITGIEQSLLRNRADRGMPEDKIFFMGNLPRR